MILIFFGPPGAGKGTQASLIAKHYKIPHLSTGEILRSKLLEKDEIANKLKKVMDTGQLVSDNFLNKIISYRINFEDCEGGFILDGYPRTMSQAIYLNSFLKDSNRKISKIIEIEVDEKIIIERIKSRSRLEKRQDDKGEIIKTRINKYMSETKPLSEFYKNQFLDIYEVVNGNEDVKEINKDIKKILKYIDL